MVPKSVHGQKYHELFIKDHANGKVILELCDPEQWAERASIAGNDGGIQALQKKTTTTRREKGQKSIYSLENHLI